MDLTESDLLVLDKLKELYIRNGRHAEEWIMRNYLRDKIDKREITKSLVRLHAIGFIKHSPFMHKAWIVDIEDNEIEEMKQPINNDSRPEMTVRLMDEALRKEEKRTGRREFSSSEMVNLFTLNFGKPREKDPDRKIRNWWKMRLYDRHGFPPRFTYSIPLRRRKELYFERPLMAYAEE